MPLRQIKITIDVVTSGKHGVMESHLVRTVSCACCFNVATVHGSVEAAKIGWIVIDGLYTCPQCVTRARQPIALTGL